MRCGVSNARREWRDMTSLYKISEGHHDASHIDGVSSWGEKMASILVQFVAWFCIGLAFLHASISVEYTGSQVYIENDILFFHRAAVALFLSRSR